MLRPAINKKTWAADLINIETCTNINDYIIVWISKEANQDSMGLNWESVWTESPTRKLALKQEEEYEKSQIDAALLKNAEINKKTNKKSKK
jgi:hypothetical protein